MITKRKRSLSTLIIDLASQWKYIRTPDYFMLLIYSKIKIQLKMNIYSYLISLHSRFIFLVCSFKDYFLQANDFQLIYFYRNRIN
jgi:hypothetical protein